jgi:hypothetical protein
MRFEQGRMALNKSGFSFDLNGGASKGPSHVVRAARDPVSIPTEPSIVALAQRCLCVLGLGSNCFTLTNVYGVIREVPYGASYEDWKKIAEELLAESMEEDAR